MGVIVSPKMPFSAHFWPFLTIFEKLLYSYTVKNTVKYSKNSKTGSQLRPLLFKMSTQTVDGNNFMNFRGGRKSKIEISIFVLMVTPLKGGGRRLEQLFKGAGNRTMAPAVLCILGRRIRSLENFLNS